MFWKTIRGWSDSNMEPSLSLVSFTTYFLWLLIHFLHSTAPPSTTIVVAVCALPEELTPEWKKQPLGDHMVTNVASLLESGNKWKCKSHFYFFDSSVDSVQGNVPGLSVGPGTLSMTSRACDVLVNSMLQFSLHMTEYYVF